jgi:hypothetical protein
MTGLALAAVLVLGGCGSDEPDTGPDPTPSTSGASDPTESPGSTSASPSVSAATGLPVKIRTVSLTGPEGWVRLADEFANLGRGVRSAEGGSLVGLYSVPSLNPDATLDEMVATVKELESFQGKPQVHEPVTVNGVECFHVSGDYKDGQHEEEFGTIHDRDEISITFSFAADFPEAERQDIIDSVLASVVWR